MANQKTAENYISNSPRWSKELAALRALLIATQLEECIKWGMPCYTYKGKNVVGLAGFKSYFGLWFHQGALLTDPEKKLINAQEGKTKALRQWRMTSSKDIKPTIIKRFVKESIANINSDTQIKPQKAPLQAVLPTELKDALAKQTKLSNAFYELSQAKQREYSKYITEAKQASTKSRRLKKIAPLILGGHGLHDHYR